MCWGLGRSPQFGLSSRVFFFFVFVCSLIAHTMRARVCFLKMTEDPWSTEVAIQHPLPGAGLIDDSGSATSKPPVAIRRGRRLSPTSISPGRLCCPPEYHRYHAALVPVVVDRGSLYCRANPVEHPGAPSPRVGPRHLRRTPVGEPSEKA